MPEDVSCSLMESLYRSIYPSVILGELSTEIVNTILLSESVHAHGIYYSLTRCLPFNRVPNRGLVAMDFGTI